MGVQLVLVFPDVVRTSARLQFHLGEQQCRTVLVAVVAVASSHLRGLQAKQTKVARFLRVAISRPRTSFHPCAEPPDCVLTVDSKYSVKIVMSILPTRRRRGSAMSSEWAVLDLRRRTSSESSKFTVPRPPLVSLHLQTHGTHRPQMRPESPRHSKLLPTSVPCKFSLEP
ncbi:hypothetical protein IG631_15100 [Alternaria alternata]|nr:hypothetical protein IG631_15100 [Alternaria alternata]